MSLPLFEPATLGTYLLAAVALMVAPGPGQALVLARTLQGGTRHGVLTALGLELGTLVHTLAAALGLSAILATSAAAFAVVKWLGAGYLVWLGISALRAAGRDRAAEVAAPAPTHHVLLRAAVTGLLNPKVALFFLAFLPQFVTPARGHVFLQFVVLGLLFALLGLAGDSLLAMAAGRARTRLVRSTAGSRWRERVTGTVLIGLGLRLALVQRG
ncbi:MAG: LysE family translocator [Gemmatimonadetes bacterium]|nr:LysE family translocator [Gemmatimonadota bacterium]